MIQQQISNIALVVANYDDAIAFYTQKLQFNLVEDSDLGGGKRRTLGADVTTQLEWH